MDLIYNQVLLLKCGMYDKNNTYLKIKKEVSQTEVRQTLD